MASINSFVDHRLKQNLGAFYLHPSINWSAFLCRLSVSNKCIDNKPIYWFQKAKMISFYSKNYQWLRLQKAFYNFSLKFAIENKSRVLVHFSITFNMVKLHFNLRHLKYCIYNIKGAPSNYCLIRLYFLSYYHVYLFCMNVNKGYLSFKVVYVRRNLIILNYLICFH